MCLLALFFRVTEDAYLVVGANREESYARDGEAPQILDGPRPAVGGRDPVAGGTWLGVNARGVFVALTNRLKTQGPAAPRSRGLLVRDLLACPSAALAVDLAQRELGANRYDGCNVVVGDPERLVVLHGGDWLRVRPWPSGRHILTNHDVNDGSDRRLGHAQWWLHQHAYGDADDSVTALKALCAQPGNPDPAMCIRGKDRGTVSSSILVLRESLAGSRYLHAQGPPDTTPYADCSALLRQIAEETAT